MENDDTPEGGMEWGEIAAHFGTTPQAAHQQAKRAIRALWRGRVPRGNDLTEHTIRWWREVDDPMAVLEEAK